MVLLTITLLLSLSSVATAAPLSLSSSPWIVGGVAILLASLIYVIIQAEDLLRRLFIEDWQRFGIEKPSEILLVIAHPDDECMFFVPTLLALCQAGHQIHVLCLSTGNYTGQGKIRVKELAASCHKLGCKSWKALDIAGLRDGEAHWDPIVVAHGIELYLNEIDDQDERIKILLTFDRYGISIHPNHCDVSTGVRYFASSSQSEYLLLELETLPLWLKYSGPLAIIYLAVRSILLRAKQPTSSLLCTVGGWKQGVQAMARHQSQLVWFRYLYLMFSSYLHVNSLLIRQAQPFNVESDPFKVG